MFYLYVDNYVYLYTTLITIHGNQFCLFLPSPPIRFSGTRCCAFSSRHLPSTCSWTPRTTDTGLCRWPASACFSCPGSRCPSTAVTWTGRQLRPDWPRRYRSACWRSDGRSAGPWSRRSDTWRRSSSRSRTSAPRSRTATKWSTSTACSRLRSVHAVFSKTLFSLFK